MAKLFYAIVFAALVCVCCEQSSTGRTLSVFEQRALEVGGKALKKDTVFCNGHLFVKSEPGAFNTTASEYTQASLSVESTPITEADRLNQQGLGWKGEVKYMCSSGAARDWADYRHSWSEWRNMGGGTQGYPVITMYLTEKRGRWYGRYVLGGNEQPLPLSSPDLTCADIPK